MPNENTYYITTKYLYHLGLSFYITMMNTDLELDFEHDIKDSEGLNVTERKLLEALRELGLNPLPHFKISRMTVDLAFPEQKLAVEVNGTYHKSEKQKVADQKRWFVLQKNGWQRKSFDASRVYQDPRGVATIIRSLLSMQGNEQIYANQPLEGSEHTIENLREFYSQLRSVC